MSIERERAQEIVGWNEREQKLLRRRDRLVALSIPGWMAIVGLLPKFIQTVNIAIKNPEITGDNWVYNAMGLAVIAGWGVFEGAEYTELARLRVLETLERNKVDVSKRVFAGKFPWVKHFVDEESVSSKIGGWVKGLRNKE